jgi:hypothetical protein
MKPNDLRKTEMKLPIAMVSIGFPFQSLAFPNLWENSSA